MGWNVWRGGEGDVNNRVNWGVGSEHVQKNSARPGMEPDDGSKAEAGEHAAETDLYCR